MNRRIGLLWALLPLLAGPVLAAPVIPDYTFQLVGGKPGVIAGHSVGKSSHLGLSAPNPVDTGQGVGYQYLAVECNPANYAQQVRLYHRNAVVAYDDVNSQNAFIESIAHANDSGHDGRRASVEGATLDVYAAIGRMTDEGYWIYPSGASSGSYYEWQPRDARTGEATYNQYLIYPDSDPGDDGLGVHHTSTASGAWGCGGYNKFGGVYVETLDAGTASERVRGISFGTYYTGAHQWGSGLFEVGPWTAGADPMQDLGTRPAVSEHFFMSSTDLEGLVPGVDDVFRSAYHDGTYLYYLTAGAGDNSVYLSAVQITDWATAAWTQVDVSSDANLYQTFTFDSGTASTSLLDGGGLVFAPDPNNPAGPPLLYVSNGGARVFVLEAVPEPATMALLGLGLAATLLRRRGRRG